MINHLVSYVLTAAYKDRIFLSFFILLVVIVSLSLFFGASAVTEQDQFAIVFTSGSLRLISIFILTLFIIFYFSRSFENRDVDFLFSKPITRWQFILSHFLAFSLLSLLMAFTVTVAVVLLSPSDFGFSLLVWGGSIFIELVVLSAMAIFFGIAFNNAVPGALATIGFYVLARLIGDIIGILEIGAVNSVTLVLSKIMTVISFFIPRLDLIGQTSWLVYGLNDFNFFPLLGQIVIFLGLVLSATYLDLKRRQF
ncbi:MAG: hypothetical protein AAF988_08595 [Pseudomonadota bacterium]